MYRLILIGMIKSLLHFKNDSEQSLVCTGDSSVIKIKNNKFNLIVYNYKIKKNQNKKKKTIWKSGIDPEIAVTIIMSLIPVR